MHVFFEPREVIADLARRKSALEHLITMESLPYIDEHSAKTDAPRDAVWASLLDVVKRTMGGGAALARLLGCDPVRSSGELTGEPGETVPGFRVVAAEPGRRLELRGRHRFSRYALTFTIDDDRVRARTDAAFPGVLGRLYRAAVIGTGAHKIITGRMVRQIARAA
jgi:hypothetical protein